MKNIFFRFLCWIDHAINHPIMDDVTNEKLSNASFKFCQYAWTNRTDLGEHDFLLSV